MTIKLVNSSPNLTVKYEPIQQIIDYFFFSNVFVFDSFQRFKGVTYHSKQVNARELAISKYRVLGSFIPTVQ